MPHFVAATYRSRILAALAALVLPGSAQMVGLGIQQRVQRLLYRRPNYVVQMCFNAPSSICITGPNAGLVPLSSTTPASTVGSIVLVSEVLLLMLVPTASAPTQIKCAKNTVRYQRMRQLLEQFSSKIGATTPWVCQDWASTKAAYRFFSNQRVNEAHILAGHFASTRDRFSATSGFPILVLNDTIEFSFTRENVGSIYDENASSFSNGRKQGFKTRMDSYTAEPVQDRLRTSVA